MVLKGTCHGWKSFSACLGEENVAALLYLFLVLPLSLVLTSASAYESRMYVFPFASVRRLCVCTAVSVPETDTQVFSFAFSGCLLLVGLRILCVARCLHVISRPPCFSYGYRKEVLTMRKKMK